MISYFILIYLTLPDLTSNYRSYRRDTVGYSASLLCKDSKLYLSDALDTSCMINDYS